jgi:Ca2+-binding RTX toxin-like protein
MKPIASLLLALALHAAALSQASANDGTFKPQQAPGAPITPRQTSNPDYSIPYKVKLTTSQTLPFDVNQPSVPDGYPTQSEGFIPSIAENGYIDTRKPNDTPVIKAWNPLVSTETMPFDPSNPPSVNDAREWLAKILNDNTNGGAIRLSDLFLNPAFFAAAHAACPEADALRGELDWLMMSGVILGLDGDDGLDDFDGMDGSDDLRGSDDPDEIFGESSNGIILGGPQGDLLAPFNPSIILGGPGSDNIILGGPGTDTFQPPANPKSFNPSIILGGPGSDNIILGGPGSDGFVNGSPMYLK